MERSEKFIQSCDVISREVGGDVVLLDLASGTYFGINAVGVRIWSYLADQSRSLHEICNLVVEEFDVSDEDVESDVTALVNDLLKHGLLVRQGASARRI